MTVCATELGGRCNGAPKGIARDQQHRRHLFRSEGKQSQGSSQPPLSVFVFTAASVGQSRDALRSHSPSAGGDESTASFFQVDKLAFCRRRISQMDRCLSTAPGTRPQNRPCFLTARRKMEKKKEEIRKSDML